MDGRVLSVVFFQVIPLEYQDGRDVWFALFSQHCSKFLDDQPINGTLVKSLGNTILLSFYSSTSAITTTLDLKRFLGTVMRDYGTRIAIHTGEVVLLNGDIFGETVNIASRLLDKCKVGQMLLSRSCVLSASKLPDTVKKLDAFQIRGLSSRIEVYELSPDNEIGWLANVRRIRIPAGAPQDILPAAHENRVTAGIVDLWAGFILIVMFSLVTNARQLYGHLADVVRVQAEQRQSTNGSISSSVRASRSSLNPFSYGQLLDLEVGESAQVSFPGETGLYDIIAIFMIAEDAEGQGMLTLGQQSFELLPLQHMPNLAQTTLARSVYLSHGDTIRVANTGPQDAMLSVDAFDFVPTSSAAYRPKAFEDSYEYTELRRSINYDEMNVHFFLMPLPFFLFLHIFCGHILLGRTLGCLTRGVYIRQRKDDRPPGLLPSLVRCLAWFLTPFTFWAYIGYQRKWSDIISDTELVTVRKH